MTLPLVAIVGRPNVGKSTLFNRLTGTREALVQDRPGITRDRHYGETDWDGVPFRIVDTGGLEFSAETDLEKKMTQQAMQGIEEADVIIFMMDGRAGVTPLDREWVQRARRINKAKIFAINKIDSGQKHDLLNEFYELGLEAFVPVSAETGRGINDLLDEVAIHIRNLGLVQPMNEEVDQEEFRIAIIGRPNVGKSTLLNRMVGEERSIADPTPGTTRDPVDTPFVHKERKYRLIDTAGIRKKGRIHEAIEKFSVIKSIQSVERCHLALILIDGTEGVTEQDAHVAGVALKEGRAIIFLVNKWDEGQKQITREAFIEDLERRLNFIPYSPVLFISAKTGKDVEKVFPTIERLRDQYEHRVPTGELNRAFEQIVTSHPLPVHGGKDIKIYYITQVGIRPPTFVVFANHPKHIHFSYERYLMNSLRKRFNFADVPVKIVFKPRS